MVVKFCGKIGIQILIQGVLSIILIANCSGDFYRSSFGVLLHWRGFKLLCMQGIYIQYTCLETDLMHLGSINVDEKKYGTNFVGC